MNFWSRLCYAIRYWPIQQPVRWIFNRRLRINPAFRAQLRDMDRAHALAAFVAKTRAEKPA